MWRAGRDSEGEGRWLSEWYDLADLTTNGEGWSAIEIEYLPGQISLWVDGGFKETLNSPGNSGNSLLAFALGALDSNQVTSGTIYFDDFESRRDSYIGLLADPGVHVGPPTPIDGMVNKSYNYADAAHVHAVTGITDGETNDNFAYDANGNMTCRMEGGKVYHQVYNAENRLVTVSLVDTQQPCVDDGLIHPYFLSIVATWNFIYDGDGNRVRQEYFEGAFGEDVAVKVTSYFAGGAYELDQSGVVQANGTILVDEPSIRKYYSFGGQPVAMTSSASDTCATLCYFLTDQLGSVVAVTDSDGGLINQSRYLPFGQVRTDLDTITQTDFGFTGQRNLDAQGNDFSLGLMDYHARFYDPYITHFSQPDSISMGGPQGLNRYSYVLNNPINFTDPTGHCLGPGNVWIPDGTSACTSGSYYMTGYTPPAAPANGSSGGGGGGGGTPSSPSPCEIDPGLAICNSGSGDTGDDNKAKSSPDTIWDRYVQGWEYAGDASSIFNDPNAGWGNWAISGGYLFFWVGAHAAFIIGGGGLICAATGPGCVGAVEGLLGIGVTSQVAILGEPQITSDPFHASQSLSFAQELAQQPTAENVFLNKTISTITGGQVPSNLRPDVAVAYSDGSYGFVEIVSRSQSLISQIQKMDSMAELLNQYDITLVLGQVIPK